MNSITNFIVALFFVSGLAQTDYSNNWEDFYSYNNVKDFVIAEGNIYALVDNAVFIYDDITGDIEKMSSVNGLSGEPATSIHYSSDFERLVIGYENGLIEIIERNGEITIAPDISNFPLSSEKQIFNITEFKGNLYLSTPFAIVVYDIDNLIFGDTYFIGDGSTEVKINEIVIFEEYIYAATESGIYAGEVNNPNLIDFIEWQHFYGNNFSAISVFNNSMFVSSNMDFYKFVPSNALQLIKKFSTPIVKLKSSEFYISVSIEREASIFDTALNEISHIESDPNSNYNFKLNASYADKDAVYLCTKEFGILKTNISNTDPYVEIHPDGPISNQTFSISVMNDNLWVVYGGYSASYTPLNNQYGYSHFNDEEWKNIPYNDEYPAENLVNITIDPNHENKVFLSSWGAGNKNDVNPTTGGILIVENDEPTEFLNNKNSALEEVLPDHPTYVSIRVDGSAIDNQGNLWTTNSWVDKYLKKMSPSGNWTGYDLSEILTTGTRGLNQLIIDRTNSIWMGSRGNGALVYNENGNRKRALTTEATKGSLPHLNVRTVAVDNKNRVWIGTQAGMVVFYNAAGLFDADIYDAEPIIILDDGIPKKLLGDQPVNSIAIDGADNKWFGTDSGGAVQTSPNGQETLNIFNTSNSPLPSNNILKIKVDLSNGKVYFATDKGIVAFNNNIAAYGDTLDEVYAYPNPVKRHHDFVTIDGRNGTHLPQGTNVKILDTAGYLVYETNVIEGQELQGGKVVWDKTNLAGRKVSSGVYIVLLTTKDNSETSSTKIAIIN